VVVGAAPAVLVVVVVAAGVVVVLAARVVVVVVAARMVVVDRLVEPADVPVVEDVFDEGPPPLDVADGDEADARTVCPAASARPAVPSSDPPASHKVTARALRIPPWPWDAAARRPPPAGRSGAARMAKPQLVNG
jgi:hypothetical protein